MKTSFKIFSVLLVIYSLFTLATCYSGGENATITITLGVDSAKASVGIEQLRHEITFTGPTGTQRQTVNGRGTARATVVAGLWTIEVAAYYGEDLYAVGGTSAEVKAGRNTDVTIQMTVVWTDSAGVINPAISYDKAVGSWAELKDYIATLQPQSAKTIQLLANMAANNPITIDPAVTVTIVAPIYTTVIISRGSDNGSPFGRYMFNVQGTLNLGHGSYPDNSRVILDGAMSSGTASAPLIQIDGGTLNMNNSVILQNNKNLYSGGAVGMDTSNGGVFNMKGGIIKNNSASNGGGVFVSGVNTGDGFYMSGGMISGNEASFGGGVYIINGPFDMSGGVISSNKTDDNGGGVYCYDSTVRINGNAKINNNIADTSGTITSAKGGGICFESTGGLYLSGNAEITGNKAIASNIATGGGIYFDVTGGIFGLSENAKINGNTAISDSDSAFGGGIYASGTLNLNIGENAEITNNTAKTTATTSPQASGGGVYFNLTSGSGIFELSGNAKINNNTAIADGPYDAVGGGAYIEAGSLASLTSKMTGGEIRGNTAQGASSSLGGGVYVDSGGSFTKNSGLIDGYGSGNDPGKNKVLDANGNIITIPYGPGHAVFGHNSGGVGYGKNADSPSGNVLDSGQTPTIPGTPEFGWDF